MAAPFRLYNTLSRNIEDFVPIEEGKIRLYVCGMTVYDRCHVGHARAMVIFDSFVRYLRFRNWDVDFVRNFTDVDDKIIRRAAELGEAPIELAQRYIEIFHEDADAMGLLRPNAEPKVSESIDDIQKVIAKLIASGHAYEKDGSVWYSVKAFEPYGKLSGQKVDELRSADAGDGKIDPSDFALWKAVKPGEPQWPSPWGPGRPGWHIECSAMAWAGLGETIDIHGGGLDLVFPHHENEVAQSEAAHGCAYARYWMHNGLLTMSSGQKMGKSLGNVINVDVALSQFPAQTLRLYYLQNHYRSPLPWGDDALPDALSMLSRLYEARETALTMGGEEPANIVAEALGSDAQAVLKLGREFPAKFLQAMDEDFNTSKALGALFELARAINRLGNHKKAKKRGGPVVEEALKAFEMMANATGLMSQPTGEFLEEVKDKRLGALDLSRSDVEALLAERDAKRTAKDWAAADAIRQDLEAKQIVVMDGVDGAEWRVRL